MDITLSELLAEDGYWVFNMRNGDDIAERTINSIGEDLIALAAAPQQPIDPSHAALVARLRDAIRYLNTAYNGEYGDGPNPDDVIEVTVPPLQPGDLGEGGEQS